MKKAFRRSYCAAAVLGAAWHFLYELVPCPLTALLAPVNESVWEHLKLLFYPPLLCALFWSFRLQGGRRAFWAGALAGISAMPLLLVGAYYGLTAGFGVPASLGFDIGLYCAALLAGCAVASRHVDGRLLGPLVIGTGVFWAALAVFTLAAPPLPIFIPK